MSYSACPYAPSCHFYGIDTPTGNTEVLFSIYCHGEPRSCRIYQLRAEFRRVSITETPVGSVAFGASPPASKNG